MAGSRTSVLELVQELVLEAHYQGFPLEFYFRGHKFPLTLIQGEISGDFRGQSYDI